MVSLNDLFSTANGTTEPTDCNTVPGVSAWPSSGRKALQQVRLPNSAPHRRHVAGAAARTMRALARAQPAAGAAQRRGLPGEPAVGLALTSANPDPHLSLGPGNGDVPGEAAVGQRVCHDLARLARVRVVEQTRVHRPARRTLPALAAGGLRAGRARTGQDRPNPVAAARAAGLSGRQGCALRACMAAPGGLCAALQARGAGRLPGSSSAPERTAGQSTRHGADAPAAVQAVDTR
jgi:hypothetical protein